MGKIYKVQGNLNQFLDFFEFPGCVFLIVGFTAAPALEWISNTPTYVATGAPVGPGMHTTLLGVASIMHKYELLCM